VTEFLQLAAGVVFIAGLIAVQLLALYVLARIVLIAISYVPMIGKRHRHADWERLNQKPKR
jgi:hypothetical protein